MIDDAHEYGHSFLPVADLPKEQWERHVATEFCAAYQKQLGVTATFVKVGEDPPDAIIAVDGKEIAVELVSYRQRDEHHEAEVADARLKQRLSQTLCGRDLHPYGIHITWKDEPRRKRQVGMTGRRTLVPTTSDDVQSFVDEFARLVQRVERDRTLQNKRLLFRSKTRLPGGAAMTARYTAILASDFPTLARFCRDVEIERWDHLGSPPMRSSLDARGIGLDTEQLERAVRKKMERIGAYRRRAAGRPLWLVVHSDWFPTSTRLHESDRPSAISIIKGIVNSPDGFDAVWWAECTGSVDAAEIWKVA